MKIRSIALLVLILLLVFAGRYIYFLPKYDVGESFPTSSLRTAVLDENFQELDNKYILVSFWGSWCGPCRAQSPDLVGLFKKYSSVTFDGEVGFDILSVGIEQDKARWRQAIQADGLIWKNHVFDQTDSLSFFDSDLAVEFGVTRLPTKYLISPNRTIVLVDPSIAEIDAYLQNLSAQ